MNWHWPFEMFGETMGILLSIWRMCRPVVSFGRSYIPFPDSIVATQQFIVSGERRFGLSDWLEKEAMEKISLLPLILLQFWMAILKKLLLIYWFASNTIQAPSIGRTKLITIKRS
ncbi:MAG: hypothetical protein CML69_02920 [Rhodobacteraceae bacterium]|nr:hypothetical protein [Paracoccaceae bacterium]